MMLGGEIERERERELSVLGLVRICYFAFSVSGSSRHNLASLTERHGRALGLN